MGRAPISTTPEQSGRQGRYWHEVDILRQPRVFLKEDLGEIFEAS
jgi:hypothetical protein